MIASIPSSGDAHEVARLQHENVRLRKALSLRNHLEELVLVNAKLRQALRTYGRHTHPHCHTLTSPDGLTPVTRQGCLCGLDELVAAEKS